MSIIPHGAQPKIGSDIGLQWQLKVPQEIVISAKFLCPWRKRSRIHYSTLAYQVIVWQAIKMEAESFNDLIRRLQKLQALQGEIFWKRTISVFTLFLLVCVCVCVYFSHCCSELFYQTSYNIIMINVVWLR